MGARLGQHFLTDPDVIERVIAVIAPRPTDRLVEIGPGTGALTFALAERVADLTAIELDGRLASELRARAVGARNLRVLHMDALDVDYRALAEDGLLRVAGNLPYQISTALFERFLATWNCFIDFTVMVQREVAERMAAAPGNKRYGRLSIMLQARAQLELLFDVPPSAFAPPPKVDSAVVVVEPCPSPLPILDDSKLGDLVRTAFGQRRKQLRRSLAGMIGSGDLQALGVDPSRRAEELSVTEYIRLANWLSEASG
jgi:16S rRNA (adenine1518-N6/adenine1519-N6)-dimethyltransferase